MYLSFNVRAITTLSYLRDMDWSSYVRAILTLSYLRDMNWSYNVRAITTLSYILSTTIAYFCVFTILTLSRLRRFVKNSTKHVFLLIL